MARKKIVKKKAIKKEPVAPLEPVADVLQDDNNPESVVTSETPVVTE